MREQRPYGKHELFIEDDTIVSVLHGELELSETYQFCSAAAEVTARNGYCLILGDIKDSRGVTAEARRYSARWSIGKPILGTAMVNENVIARTLFTLVLTAANLIRRQSAPFAAFKTEQEARDWFAQLRRQHRARDSDEKLVP
jgi:hypothetical protein